MEVFVACKIVHILLCCTSKLQCNGILLGFYVKDQHKLAQIHSAPNILRNHFSLQLHAGASLLGFVSNSYALLDTMKISPLICENHLQVMP